MSSPTLATDPRSLRDLYAGVPSGVAAICAQIDGKPDGMAASSLVPVSIDPPLLSFCVQKSSRTWARLRQMSDVGVSVLSAQQSVACSALALREGDRFADLDWHDEDGRVYIRDASVYFACSVDRELDAGDHIIVLLRLLSGERTGTSPVVFHDSAFRSILEPSDAI